jgi:hypothetical protein
MKFEVIEANHDYLFVEITGDYKLYSGMKLMEEIFDLCQERNVNKILIDITKKQGMISNWDRYILGKLIAKLFSYKIKLAVIGRKELINKFSETVAQNRGGKLFISSDKADAMEWLLK